MSNHTTTSSAKYTPLSQLLGFEPGDFVTVATHKVQRATTMSVEDLDADYAMGLLDQQDTWIGAQPVKPTTPNRRTKAGDVACVRVLYADFDKKDGVTHDQVTSAIEQISQQIGAAPISVVESGGGWHPRWKLAKSIEPQDAKGVLGRWQLTVQRVAEENGFKADSVFDLPRVLRLPGTVNEKYSPPVPVTITPDSADTVPTAAVWSKLDQHPTKLKGQKKTAPADDVDLDVSDATTEVPPRPEPVDTLSERAVNAAISEDLALLAKLKEDGWDGLPWHNTVRDVTLRLAKIAKSPSTSISEEEVEKLFLDAVPRDGVEDWDEDITRMWESALELAEGEIYELIGSGDELFADDFESMMSGVASSKAAAEAPDVDFDLDLDDLDEPSTPRAPLAPAGERYAALEMPLVPGFNGAAALRVLEIPEGASSSLINRLKVLGEDISDLHDIEHDEYLHPHCMFCFPESWREQLYRWSVRNPRVDSYEIRPPMGRVAPGEGYVDGFELLGLPDSEMLLDGFIPTGAIGILAGRNGCGKTFLALDMAMHIMDEAKNTWGLADIYADDEFGSINDHGGVLFYAGEGFRSVKSRLRAWLKHHGYEDRPSAAPEWLRDFDLRGEVPNFFTGGEDYDKMLERVARTKPRFVVVDTLQKAAAGADQDSASDMAVVHSRLARLKSLVDGMTVMVIAHSTKDDSSVRGSSAIEDDADFVLHARKGSGSKPNELEVTKMRDSEAPAPLDYYLAPVGHSVVVSSTQTVAPDQLVDERQKVELLTALHTLHGAKGASAELSVSEIVKQTRGMDQPEVYTLLAHHLLPEGLVIITNAGGGKYQLTSRGRQWLESRDAAIFARSKGLS